MRNSPELLKFFCDCGQKVSATEDQFEMTLTCPTCGNQIRIPEPPNRFRRSLEVLKGLSGIGAAIIAGACALFLCAIILIGVAKVSAVIEPWVSFLFALCFLFILPASLLFSIFKTTRIAGGYGIFWTAKLMILCQWMISLIYCVSSGIVWAVVGLMFYGIGILPMSCILMVFHGEWFNSLLVVVTVVTYYMMTYFSHRLIASGYMHQALEKFGNCPVSGSSRTCPRCPDGLPRRDRKVNDPYL